MRTLNVIIAGNNPDQMIDWINKPLIIMELRLAYLRRKRRFLEWFIKVMKPKESMIRSRGNWKKYSTLGDLRNLSEAMAKRAALRRMAEQG